MQFSDITYLIGGFGAIAIAASSPKISPSSASSPASTSTAIEKVEEKPATPILRRHKVSLNLTSLQDLKIKEGDRVNEGDLLSDRTEQRINLEAQRNRLRNAIEQMSKPLTPIAQLPEPDFSKQLLAIEESKIKLNQLQSVPLPEFRAKEGDFRAALDFEIIERKANLEQQKLQAEIDLQKAIANLAEAKNNYQYQQYEHSLKMQQYQSNIQRQQYQIGELMAQLQKVEDDLERIAGVRSPASGRVRRVKVLGQSDRNIQIEVLIDPRETSDSESP